MSAPPPPARVFTTFGTALFVDPNSGELRHGPIDTSPENLMLVVDDPSGASLSQVRLVSRVDGREQTIALRATSDSLPHETLELVTLERGLLALRAGGVFLCAEPSGAVALSRDVCSTWEAFHASEDWCTPLARGRWHEAAGIDWRGIGHFSFDPTLRAKTRHATEAKKILVFANPEWSNGRVYYDVATHLYEHGYIIDVLSWRVFHPGDLVRQLLGFYDHVLTGLDGIHILVNVYGVPMERIIGLSHGIYYDLPLLVEQMGSVEPLERLAGFGVVSYSMVSECAITGVRRVPTIASLGVTCAEFRTEPPKQLATVGYATAMSHTTNTGIEKKRGELAEASAKAAGLTFRPAGSYDAAISFHDMPDYYRQVDAVLMTSLIEAAGLPTLEAAAAARLVIGTPVGHFPQRAYHGAGLLAPLQADKFVAYAGETLAYYKREPSAFTEKCREIQEGARKFDWAFLLPEWIELLETTRSG